MSNLTAAQLKELSGINLDALQHFSVERLKEYVLQYSAPGFRLGQMSYFTVEEWLVLLNAELSSRDAT